MSKGYFEGMMINEFVDIEGGVDIKNIHIFNFMIDGCIRWELREKMCAASNGVDVDNAGVAHSLAGEFWLYDPHASIGFGFVAHQVPTDKRTRVVDTVVRESKKEVDMCNKKSPHPLIL